MWNRFHVVDIEFEKKKVGRQKILSNWDRSSVVYHRTAARSGGL